MNDENRLAEELVADNDLAAALGHDFANRNLLRLALTHKSAGYPNNERFEFLGDAALNMIVAEMIFRAFPEMSEGDMSRHRSNIVRHESLSKRAAEIGLGKYLKLGEGELNSGGQTRPSILADALEAVIGAVYLDAGLIPAQNLVSKLFGRDINAIDPLSAKKDAKTTLQEILQAKKFRLPQYSTTETSGAEHAKEFVAQCYVEDLRVRTTGQGRSRKTAEQEAAANAVARVTEILGAG